MFIDLMGFLLFSDDMTSERFDLIDAEKCDSFEFGKRLCVTHGFYGEHLFCLFVDYYNL